MFKQLILILLLIIGLTPILVFAIEAGEIFKPGDINPESEIGGVKIGKVDNIEKIDDIYAYLKKLLEWVFGIFLSVAVVFIIWAGYIYMTGAGDEEKIRNARKRIVWAIVAIAVALLAGSIVLFIQNFLGGTGGSQQEDQSYPGGPYQPQTPYQYPQ